MALRWALSCEQLKFVMFSIKRLIRFCWLLPGIYVCILLIYILGMISGAGHIPRSFEPLFYVLAWPISLVNWLLPKAGTKNPVLDLILFVVIGFLTYALLGFLLDIAIKKYRNRRR